MERMKDDVEKALRVANFIRDEVKKLKGKVRNYSGLNAAFKTELYADEGVIKTRPVKQNEDTSD
tara:strand:+ start:281 stop:472 length:192 start_codon:yes stop_codon:yes gene_type:complete